MTKKVLDYFRRRLVLTVNAKRSFSLFSRSMKMYDLSQIHFDIYLAFLIYYLKLQIHAANVGAKLKDRKKAVIYYEFTELNRFTHKKYSNRQILSAINTLEECEVIRFDRVKGKDKGVTVKRNKVKINTLISSYKFRNLEKYTKKLEIDLQNQMRDKVQKKIEELKQQELNNPVKSNLMNNNRFTGLNLDQAKSKYREEAKKCHPDRGGKKEDFQRLNDEFREYIDRINDKKDFQNKNFDFFSSREALDPEKTVAEVFSMLPEELQEKLTGLKGSSLYKVASSGIVSDALKFFGKKNDSVKIVENLLNKL